MLDLLVQVFSTISALPIFLLISSALLSLSTVQIFIILAKQYGWGKPVRTDGPQSHLIKEGTPTMGGIAFLLVATVVWLFFATKTGDVDSIALVILVLLIAFLGLLDDFTSLKRKKRLSKGLEDKDASTGLLARYRLIFQTGIATLFATYAVRNEHTLLGSDLLDIFAFAFVIVATINAINFTDGLDGLAGGIVIVLLFPFLSIPFSICLAGALFGFLWHNVKPAKIFMGGVGSEALGAAIAGMAILTDIVWYLPLMALIPFLEVLSVILQVSYFKLTGGKRIFKMSPLHHHFELSGWREEDIVTYFWLVTVVCVALSLFLSKVVF